VSVAVWGRLFQALHMAVNSNNDTVINSL